MAVTRVLLRVALAVAVVCSAPAAAVSNGHTWMCDPHGNFGCGEWQRVNGKLDRMSCLEPKSKRGIMHWVKRPAHTHRYTLTVDGGATSYIPGGVVKLVVTTHVYTAKYKGFFADAVDADDKTVGFFEFPGSDKQLFWEPPQCPGRVIHNSADIKPFRAELYYRAPPPGTGTIRFRALIKYGEPNEGEFFYPNTAKDGLLTLTETGNVKPPTLHAAPAGMSCASYCASRSEECDAATMRSPTAGSAAGLEALVAPRWTCRPPLLQSCAPTAPLADGDGNCWFYRNDSKCGGVIVQELSSLPTCNALAGGPEQRMCEAVPERKDLHRFCACRPPSRRRRDVGNAKHLPAEGQQPSVVTSAAAAPSPMTWVAPALAAVMAMARPGAGGGGGALMSVALALALACPARAHNWLFTPGRARKTASTILPCRPRKATDTHQQVGPGQNFTMKWATGHAGDGGREGTLVVVVRGEDYKYLGNKRLLDWVDAYMDQAPEDERKRALHPAWQRYHGVEQNRVEGFLTNFVNRTTPPPFPAGSPVHVPGAELFDGAVDPSDPNFLDHTFERTRNLFRYKAHALRNDRRVQYRNAKYPWIVMAARYPQYYTRPFDWDAIRVSLPEDAEPGHYIAHYRWKGYTDCVDINLHDTPVADVDGKDFGSYVWNKVDHCQYVDVRDVKTSCHLSGKSPDVCVKQLAQSRTESNCGDDCATRVGINVVPFKNPSTVAFPEEINIPWRNGTCANTALTLRSGSTIKSPVDWARFNHTLVANATCTLPYSRRTIRGTLRQAAEECDVLFNTCGGVAAAGDFGLSAAKTVVRTWSLCLKPQAAASLVTTRTAWTAFTKPGSLYDLENPDKARPVTRVVFTLPGYSGGKNVPKLTYNLVGESSDTLVDTGRAFAAQAKGPKRGWKCAGRMFRESTEYLSKRNNYWRRLYPGNFVGNRQDVVREYNISAGDSSLQLHTAFCQPQSGPRTRNVWEIELANGVYDVRAEWSRGSNGRYFTNTCMMEGQLLGINAKRFHPDTWRRRLTLRDGRMTLHSASEPLGNPYCDGLYALTFTRVADDLPRRWTPPGPPEGAFVQHQAAVGDPAREAAPIGLVTLVPNGFFSWGGIPGSTAAMNGLRSVQSGVRDCRQSYGFARGRCERTGYSTDFEVHSRPDEGFYVIVSNSSCDDSSGTCDMDNAHICNFGRRITKAARQTKVEKKYQVVYPFSVDCGGAVGKYVQAFLPGPERDPALTIMVNLAEPILDPDPSVPAGVSVSPGQGGGKSACVPTWKRQASYGTFEAVCVHDRNPEVPMCSGGKSVNVAARTVTNGVQAHSIPQASNNLAVILEGYGRGYTRAVGRATIDCRKNQNTCVILVDLQQVHDLERFEWWTGNKGANQPNKGRVTLEALVEQPAALCARPSRLADGARKAALVRLASRPATAWRTVYNTTVKRSAHSVEPAGPVRARVMRLTYMDHDASVLLHEFHAIGCDACPTRAPASAEALAGTRPKFGRPLGWFPIAGLRNRFGASPLSAGGSTRMSFDYARDACAALGGRLPTRDEVRAGEAREGSRFFPRTQNVWTTTPCDHTSGSLQAEDAFVCYGVEARAHKDASTPEFIISKDPADPIFYSTCYVREFAIEFLPPPGSRDGLFKGSFLAEANTTSEVYNDALKDESFKREWDFNGACLECSDYHANSLRAGPSIWTLAPPDQCFDCDRTVDHLADGCSAERPVFTTATATGETEVESFTRSGTRCSRPVTTSAECFAATRAVLAEGVGVQDVSTAELPPGCSGRLTEGTFAAYFNKPESGDLAAALEAPCSDPTLMKTVVGELQLMPNVNVALAIDRRSDAVTLTLTGPANSWFAVGFEANAMADLPYTIVVSRDASDDVTVTERALGNHVPGTALAASLTVTNWTVTDALLTVVLTRGRVGATEDHYTFPADPEASVPVIGAIGYAPKYAFHRQFQRGRSLVLQPTDHTFCLCHVRSVTTTASPTEASLSTTASPTKASSTTASPTKASSTTAESPTEASSTTTTKSPTKASSTTASPTTVAASPGSTAAGGAAVSGTAAAGSLAASSSNSSALAIGASCAAVAAVALVVLIALAVTRWRRGGAVAASDPAAPAAAASDTDPPFDDVGAASGLMGVAGMKFVGHNKALTGREASSDVAFAEPTSTFQANTGCTQTTSNSEQEGGSITSASGSPDGNAASTVGAYEVAECNV